jgi:hypothetical protein
MSVSPFDARVTGARGGPVASVAEHARDVVGPPGDLDDPQPAAALLALQHVNREHALQEI